jgi:hypothetical protein
MAIPLAMPTVVCSYYCFVVSIAHISLKPDGKLVVLVVTTKKQFRCGLEKVYFSGYAGQVH